MIRLKLFLLTGVVGALTAVTYLIFEGAVHSSINFVWNSLFATSSNRWGVVPLCVGLTLVFFGFRHLLDRKSEETESHSLGESKINVSLKNFLTILFIGFWSLLAGASLGPEAILVPASVVLGMCLAEKFGSEKSELAEVMKGAALVALMAAFFHSFLVGLLSLALLYIKSKQTKFNSTLLIVGSIAAGASALTLSFLDPSNSYFKWPSYSLTYRLIDWLIALFLIFVGYGLTWLIRYSHDAVVYFRNYASKYPWWIIGIIAGLGLSILYLLGGPLVEFTGNLSIASIFEQASVLGVAGILWILIIKIIAIGFSKAFWYRGGMIFPTIFVASGIIALIGQVYTEGNFFLWLIAIMVGALVADRKAKILL